MTSAVDGLVSGINTTQMITQLMAIEAAPQDRLKQKVSTAQTAIASYQSVNSKVDALQKAASALSSPDTWRGIKATSSSSTVSATAVAAGSNSGGGTTTFDVVALAKAQITTAKVDPAAAVTSSSSFTITVGPADVIDPDTGVVTTDNSAKRKDYPITLTDLTAQGVATAVNTAGIGVKATVVSTGGAQNILQFSSTGTGTANAFTVSGFDPATTTVATAADARLQIGGGEAHGGYDVVSGTNTFTGLLSGVSVTVSKLESDVTVQASQDVGGIADKFQALVDAANATLTEITKQTAYDTSSNTGSPLTGDFGVRNMAQAILSKISMGVQYPDPDDSTKTKTASLAQLGITLDEHGTIFFDRKNFTDNYNTDPASTQKFGTILGNNVSGLATSQTVSLTKVMQGRNTEISTFNSQISDWDVRLSMKKQALQKQYSDLEVALGKLKDQQSWLSGQLAGLS